MKKANNNKWNNANPRGTQTDERYKKSVPAEIYAKYERSEAAHKNGMGKTKPLHYKTSTLKKNMQTDFASS